MPRKKDAPKAGEPLALVFKELKQRLIDRGKSRGALTYEEINRTLDVIEHVSPEQLDEFFEEITAAEIALVDEQEYDEASRLNDGAFSAALSNFQAQRENGKLTGFDALLAGCLLASLERMVGSLLIDDSVQVYNEIGRNGDREQLEAASAFMAWLLTAHAGDELFERLEAARKLLFPRPPKKVAATIRKYTTLQRSADFPLKQQAIHDEGIGVPAAPDLLELTRRRVSFMAALTGARWVFRELLSLASEDPSVLFWSSPLLRHVRAFEE